MDFTIKKRIRNSTQAFRYNGLFKINIEELSLMAFEDPSTDGNPKKINREDLKLMYEYSISGDLFK